MKLSLLPVVFLLAGCSINVSPPDVGLDASSFKLPTMQDAAPCPEAGVVVVIADAGAPETGPVDACRAGIACYCDRGYISVEKFDSKACDLKTAYALCQYLMLNGDVPSCEAQ